MAILVTGGCGYIGSLVVRKLYQEGQEPVSFDLAPIPDSMSDLKDKVKFVRGDILNATDILRTIKEEKIDRVIHTISLLLADSQANPVSAYKINIGGTVNVLEAARIMPIKRMVYISSIAIYGATSGEFTSEEHPLNPVTLYGVTKLACEHFGLNYTNDYGIDFVSLRLAYVWGPGRERGAGTIATLVENPVRGLPAKVAGGNQKYELVYLKDVVKAITLACFATKLKHRVFNISSGEMVTLQEVAEIVKSYIPDAKMEIASGSDLAFPGGLPAQCDISKAREEIGYEPDFKKKEALKDYMEQILKRRKL